VVVAGAAVAGALLLRRQLALVVAVVVLASALSAAAWDGLTPITPGRFTGVVTLVHDPSPVPVGLGVSADARLPDGGRVEVVDGDPRSALVDLLAGEQVHITGRLRPLDDAQGWAVPRHLRGRLDVESALPAGGGGVLSRAANEVRRTLQRGAAGLPEDHRALFTGLVLGDDRLQTAEQADAFRAAGLSHLLAVSGQNVAFVLILAGPLLARLGRRSRLWMCLAVLVGFAWLTRAEPSVLRAVAMAGIAAAAVAVGRRGRGLQVLGLAVCGLVLVDPLLVESLGFRLSVAASAGIIVGAAAIARWVPGPRPVARAVGVTVAAQAAVAPLLLTSFGGLPAVGLLANVAAAPAAGPITAWGLTAGLVAGWVPAGVARLLHLPTAALLWWIDGVAHAAARAPTGQLGWAHVVALAVLGGVAGAWTGRCARAAVLVLAAAVLLHPAVALRSQPEGRVALVPGAELWRQDGTVVVVVDGRARPAAVFERLRAQAVTAIDLLIGRTTGAQAVVRELHARFDRARVVLPDGPGAAAVGAVIRGPTSLVVGGHVVQVRPGGSGLEVLLPTASGGPGGRW
jgi:competence protein ComEC